MKKRLSKAEKVLFVLPLLVSSGLWLRAFRSEKLTPKLQTLSGAGARDCSCATIPEGNLRSRAMKDCAADAFARREPFWMDNLNEADGAEASGWAFNRSGHFFAVRQTRTGWLKVPRLDIARIEGVKFRRYSIGSPREIVYKSKTFLTDPQSR